MAGREGREGREDKRQLIGAFKKKEGREDNSPHPSWYATIVCCGAVSTKMIDKQLEDIYRRREGCVGDFFVQGTGTRGQRCAHASWVVGIT
jgi:hypothetical protein